MLIRSIATLALLACAAPPSASETGGTASLAVSLIPIEVACQQLSAQTTATVVARGKTVGQRVSLIARDVPLERALDSIVAQKPNWLWYKPEGKPDTYEIWDQESFRAQVVPTQARQRVYRLANITSEEAYRAVRGILTPNIGTAAFDPRSNKLIVTDLPPVLELIARLVEQIDVELKMHVFKVARADTREMAEHLSSLRSPAAPTPLVDERTRQIIVFDRPDVIRTMKKVLATFDI
jgi:type II secretory pathway component GspD/PulD (secretin)